MERDPLRAAVEQFWIRRDVQAREQRERGTTDQGNRGSATSGQHLDAIRDLLVQEFSLAGISEEGIHISNPTLPGYYRPTKKWDIVVVQDDSLVAAIELKSMVGSEGNNLNNRSEEAIGNATDLKRAFRAGLLGPTSPWLGYFFVLGESERTNRPVATRSRIFPVDPELSGSSYAERSQALLERMLADGIYDGACLLTTRAGQPASIEEPSEALAFEAFRIGIRDCVGQFLS